MKKRGWLILCICLILGFIYYFNNKPSNKLLVKEYTLNFNSGCIYVKTSVSEIYDRTEIIAFSSKPVTNDMYAVYNGKTDRYDFCDHKKILRYNVGCLFYKISNDTLYIYSVLEGFGNLPTYSKRIKIVPINCERYEWHQYQENPKKYGLTKISVDK